jgi:hypothetical protein
MKQYPARRTRAILTIGLLSATASLAAVRASSTARSA